MFVEARSKYWCNSSGATQQFVLRQNLSLGLGAHQLGKTGRPESLGESFFLCLPALGIHAHTSMREHQAFMVAQQGPTNLALPAMASSKRAGLLGENAVVFGMHGISETRVSACTRIKQNPCSSLCAKVSSSSADFNVNLKLLWADTSRHRTDDYSPNGLQQLRG